MQETYSEKIDSSLTLIELQNKIKSVIEDSFFEYFWVSAEINEMNIAKNGHCFMELVQKDESSEKMLAKARANIWSAQFRMIQPYFESVTGYQLAEGLKLLVKCSVDFHPVYGLSLNIRDIDPTYSLGDIAKRRREIIQQLENDGILDLNQQNSMPNLPQRIAIISSENAAGYGDFMEQLHNNKFGFRFYTKLFKALVQGEQAEDAIISAFDRIFAHENKFNLVVLIRGGGSKSDLRCFDSYELAMNIAHFPLPVLTGIGHDRDESIADIVAHSSFKTPTAVADFLIEKANFSYQRLLMLQNEITTKTKSILTEKKITLERTMLTFRNTSAKIFDNNRNRLNSLCGKLTKNTNLMIQRENLKLINTKNRLHESTQTFFYTQKLHAEQIVQQVKPKTKKFLSNKRHAIQMLEKSADLLNPFEILKRGYSITRINAKTIHSVEKLKKGDQMVTQVSDGKILSEIKQIIPDS